MKILRPILLAPLALAALAVACSDNSTSPGGGNGTVVVKLTDAPFLTDSVARVDVYVVRVDGRVAEADSVAADSVSAQESGSGGWQALAAPNALYNLLAFQNGATTTLGQAALAANTYNGLRFIIDPSKSSVTLKNGTVLTGNSTPGIKFPSAAQTGIKVLLQQPLKVVGGKTTTLIVDFDVNNSFVQRGNSISKNGLLFKPVIRGTVIDAATVDATVRLANASNDSLTFLQNGNLLFGGAVPFGGTSTCSLVPVANPLLTVVKSGTTTPLSGFPTTTLTAGQTYTYLAFHDTTGTHFTVFNTSSFTPTAGMAGLQVFNASGLTTGLDVYVTAPGAPLGTPTVTNLANDSTSAWLSVPADSEQVRVTSTGSTTVLADLGKFGFTAGQNATLVIAPAAAADTTHKPRSFLVPGC